MRGFTVGFLLLHGDVPDHLLGNEGGQYLKFFLMIIAMTRIVTTKIIMIIR